MDGAFFLMISTHGRIFIAKVSTSVPFLVLVFML